MASTWFQRLVATIEASGRPYRDISLGAGLGHAYVHQLVSEGKQPTVDKFISLCAELGVSPIQIITGADLNRETDQLLMLFNSLSLDQRSAVLNLLEQIPASPKV